MSPRVHVVLVNWNGWRDTIECLESLFRLDYPDFTVVVCDNHSGDDSLERIREWARGERPVAPSNPTLAHLVTPPVGKPVPFADYDRREAEQGGRLGDRAPLVLVQTGANLGFAGGNNVGFRYALARGADFVWALNNDTVVAPGALRALIDRQARKGITGSTLLYYDQPDRVQAFGCASFSKRIALAVPIGAGCPANAIPEDPTDVEAAAAYVVGASMLIPRSFLEEVGMMCEDYFLYFEELDWAQRGRSKGYGLFYAPESIAYHKVGATTRITELGNGLRFAERLSYQNRLLVTIRHFPEALPLVRSRLLLESLRALLSGRTSEARFIVSTVLAS